VAVENWTEVKGAHGSNFQPQFLIKKLVDRPADLQADQGPSTPSHATGAPGEAEAIDADEPEDFSEFEAA
jgi:hypothetical protein